MWNIGMISEEYVTWPSLVNLHAAPPGGPPQSLRIVVVTGEAIVLTWDIPKNTGGRDDLFYTVTYRVGSSNIVVSLPDTEITLPNLLPQTTYNITVRVENGVSFQDIAGRKNRTAMTTVTTGGSSECLKWRLTISSKMLCTYWPPPLGASATLGYTISTYLLVLVVIGVVAAAVGLLLYR